MKSRLRAIHGWRDWALFRIACTRAAQPVRDPDDRQPVFDGRRPDGHLHFANRMIRPSRLLERLQRKDGCFVER